MNGIAAGSPVRDQLAAAGIHVAFAFTPMSLVARGWCLGILPAVNQGFLKSKSGTGLAAGVRRSGCFASRAVAATWCRRGTAECSGEHGASGQPWTYILPVFLPYIRHFLCGSGYRLLFSSRQAERTALAWPQAQASAGSAARRRGPGLPAVLCRFTAW